MFLNAEWMIQHKQAADNVYSKQLKPQHLLGDFLRITCHWQGSIAIFAAAVAPQITGLQTWGH